MSQYGFGTIDTATTDGVELATLLESWRDAVLSMHSGDTAPSYTVKGLMWLDTSATPHPVKLYGTSSWATIGVFNPTTASFTPYMAGSPLAALATKASVDTGDIEDDAITSAKIGAGAVLAAALGTDIIRSVHIDPTDIANIRSELGLGTAALLNSSGFGDLHALDEVSLTELANGTALRLLGYVTGGAPAEIQLGTNLTLDGSTLNASGGGSFIGVQEFTADGTWTKPANLKFVVAVVVGSGAGTPSADGETSSFGAHVSATGGSPSGDFPPLGGQGVGGDENFFGGEPDGTKGGDSTHGFGTVDGTTAPRGYGGGGNSSGAGGTARKVIDAADLGATETVTVGQGGNGSNADGADGIVIIYEYG